MKDEKMITKLTKEQEEFMPEFVKKWTDIGLSTERPNEDEILEAVLSYYEHGGLDAPKYVAICPSIESAIYFGAAVKQGLIELDDVSFAKVYDKVNAKVRAKVYAKVNAKVYDKVNAKVRAKVYDKVYDKVNDKVRAKVSLDILRSYIGLSFWSGFSSFHDYMNYIGVDNNEIKPRFTLQKNACYCFPFEDIIIFAEKPSQMLFNEQGEFQNENGLAIQWPDGTGYAFLNGTSVPEWIFDLPKDKIDPKDILNIPNVDSRTKVIEWYGLENMLKHLDYDVLDERTDHNEFKSYNYKLLNLDIGLGSKRPYLYMENPSCDEIHVEPVEGNTVQAALMFRIPERQRKLYGYKPAIARA